MAIDRYKIKLNTFSAELNGELDSNLRILITTECDIYETADQDCQNGEFNRIYRCKVVGSTIVKQGDNKPIIGKSKRSQSQRLRAKLWTINPDEDFYEDIMNRIINNAEEVIEYLTKI